MIGNNSGGTHSVVYGMTIEHVRELDVVLSDAPRGRAHFAPLGARDEVARRSARAGTLEGSLYREIPQLAARAPGR